jgi:hypothetical protein
LIHSRPLKVVILLPSAEVIAAREAAREQTGYTDWTVQALYDGFARATPRIGLWLDTSGQTSEETLAEILAREAEATIQDMA